MKNCAYLIYGLLKPFTKYTLKTVLLSGKNDALKYGCIERKRFKKKKLANINWINVVLLYHPHSVESGVRFRSVVLALDSG